MIRQAQASYISNLNRLKALQQHVAFWEQTSENYKVACETFRKYLDCLQTFRDPKALANGYIRMASFCERNDDIFLSQDLYQNAIDIMIKFGLASSSHLQHLRTKIKALRYSY